MTSEAQDKFREKFFDREWHDPLRIATIMGRFEHADYDSPIKTEQREAQRWFAAVAEQQAREKGEQ